MEKEIELINEVIANAIILGGDWEGPQEIYVENLVTAINNWLREKGLREQFHVAESRYRKTLMTGYKYLKDTGEPIYDIERTYNFPVLKIAPIGEGSDLKYPVWGDQDCIP